MLDNLQIATLTPGLLPPSLALATHRAGDLAVLDFEYVWDRTAAARAIRRFNDTIQAPFGIKLDGDAHDLIADIVEDLPQHVKTVVITSSDPQKLLQQVRLLRETNVKTLLEVSCVEHAQSGVSIGVDGLIAKGHEAGGRVAEETTFILLQHLNAEVGLPVWAYGGIGLHTAGACVAAGAAGLILDVQLALVRESPYPDHVRTKIASMDGSETLCLGDQLGQPYRVYFRPGSAVVKELQEIESRLALDGRSPTEIQTEWRQALMSRAGWESEENALLLGQDAAFAASLAKRFRTVGGVLKAFREAIRTQCEAALKLRPLAEASPLACDNGTRYPILQGPMTRVSDVPEFTARVAEAGALPFLALALMRGPEVKRVLAEAQRRLGSLPWGVGILGFVPPELRQEQMEAILENRPPFALIAGGRPDHARALEQHGTATYLHVPSPGLLRIFVQQGARRFVFEGRECGGHVGPRTSFVLWNQMVEVLLEAPALAASPQEFHVVFAAGIHDALSAAMVSVIAAPLAERGVRVGVLLGTAYLFTEEAVASGAIVDTFQEQAQQCHQTVLLETGPGHASRCVVTPFADAFTNEKRRLLAAGRPAEEIRMTLEGLNLGRLRIASKGITRNPGFAEDARAQKLVAVDRNEQLEQGMYMIGQVAALRKTVCTLDDLHREVAVDGSNRLKSLSERFQEMASTRPAQSPSDVAVIGMACVLPKAPDLSTYWENILQKVDAVDEIPKDRWDWELYFDADRKAKDKIYSRWGGFVQDVRFDPMQYGMPPASLRSIEPAQLLTLEVVRAALADAGYLERSFERERTSVIFGAGGGAADLGLGYSARSFIPNLEALPEFRGRSQEIIERLDRRLPEWTEDSFAGILTNVSAGRVANRFDLGGSNYTVDAACASSLAAVSLALKELESRNSDMVIVGGIDTMQNPFTYLCFSKTHALSARGRCRTFDESADGIALSEGVAMLVLKRLADAERDGDRIYAVIKGAGSSSDGKDRGLTAPRPEGQALALKRAYAKAGISPATVGLVEAHGTGTVAGDSAEVQALTTVFSEAEAPLQSCAIGSVKSMIGHTKCTAGAAGLVKAALALHHKILPPTLGVEKPNPKARFPETPFFVNTEVRPWLESPEGHPRRAGVSAFGFGGSNFHLVLEEYTGEPFGTNSASCREWSDELFLWRADSHQELLDAVAVWEKALGTDAKPELRDLAFTAWKKAEGNARRKLQLAIIASSLSDLRQKLGWAHQGLTQPNPVRINDPRGIYFSAQPLAAQGKLAFLFPGQGSQYPRMLQDLLIHFPEMRQSVERAVRALDGKLDRPLSAFVFPPPTFSKEEEQTRQQALTQTNIAQPALGAVSLALFRLLTEFGLQPEMACGHSYGEYVALAAAGVFDPDTLVALSEARGRFIVEGAGAEPGTMAAIEADAKTVADVVATIEGVCLANANAPKQNVISGTRAAVGRAVEGLAARGATARIIPVACAFHSPLVAAAKARLAEFLEPVKVADPRFTVYSNTTAEAYPTSPQAVKQMLAEHLVEPVQFVREIEAMYAGGARVFVEVGPRGLLSGLVDQILGDRPKLAVASNLSSRSGLTQLLHMLGQLAAQGCVLKLDRLYRNRSDRQLDVNSLERECAEKVPSPSTWLVNGSRALPLKEFSKVGSLKTPLISETVLKTKTPPLVMAAVATSGAESHVNGKANGKLPSQFVLATPSSSASSSLPTITASSETGTPRFSSPDSAVGTATPIIPRVVTPKIATTPPTASLSSVSAITAPPVAAASTAPASPAVPQSLDGVPQVMLQFQHVMSRFLDTHKAVMLAYLSDGTAVPAPALPIEVPTNDFPRSTPHVKVEQPPIQHPGNGTIRATDSVPTAHTPAIAEDIVTPTRIAEVAPVVQKAPYGPSKDELTAQLLSIVSERTGYPPEMLDLSLDLEADLGIDSIKRVEILGTFQQSFAAIGGGAEEGLMEKLASVRTLQGIIDGVTEQLTVAPASVITTEPAIVLHQQVSPQAAATLNKSELTVKLLSIVSERTGYPAEMLDLNLDLEADLGIDSIKRVEILGTFQQSFAAIGGVVEEGLMEKLAGVRTLQGIIDGVSDQIVGASTGVPSKLNAGNVIREQQAISKPSGALNKAELTEQLLAIVSERTGYPPEMLDLNLDLEADLGIDSIKRVEILGTFQQSFASAGVSADESLMEKLAGVRTLQGIIDRVLEQVSGNGEAAQHQTFSPVHPGPPQVTNAREERIRRFTLTAVETPLPTEVQPIAKNRTVLITDDGHGVAQSLSTDLAKQGYIVAFVLHGSGVKEVERGSYVADLGSLESVVELLAMITERQGHIGTVIHLLPLGARAEFHALDYQSWKTQLRLGGRSLFNLAKSVGKQLCEASASGSCLISATGMGGTFLCGPVSTYLPDHGAITGLIKTLAQEWPDVRVKALDLNLNESSTALAKHVFDELTVKDEHVEIGYNGQRRLTLQGVDSPVLLDSGFTPVLDSSSVVLVTGGARGITARAALRFAELYRPKLVLAGRSPLPEPKEAAVTAGITDMRELKAALIGEMRRRGEPATPALVERAYAKLIAAREVRNNLAAVRQCGAEVHYREVDVRDADTFGALIDGIYKSFGRLDGVIHGAGVIEDKLVQDKAPDSFDRVFDTKVDSAFILSQKLRPQDLKFLVFFSSISGRFGNRGQGDYAAANEVLNKLAACLDHAWPGRVVAINWGPWETEGMVSAEVRKQFAERGVELITPAVGLRYLDEELRFGRKGEAEVVVGGGSRQLSKHQEASQFPLPLLTKAVVSRSGDAVELLRELNIAHDLYLADHRLDGQPVLPLAVATELMAEAVAQGWPGMQVAAIRQLRVFHGVVLENGTKTVRVVARPQSIGSDVTEVAVEITGTGKPHRIHYRATVELAPELPRAPRMDVAPLKDGQVLPMEVAEIYRRWLFHGPVFHGIQEVDVIAPAGVQALLAPSTPMGWIAGMTSGQWLIDPLMFDSALQLVLVWAREHWDMTALPSGFQKYQRFAGPPASSILCELRIRPTTGKQTIHADIFFLDAADGRVLGVLEDMDGACSKALNRLADRQSLAAVGK